jgi:N-acetylglucosaminyldiphosphoundecaprenol N-acetyl-beta-D-mannosaminyltransferase
MPDNHLSILGVKIGIFTRATLIARLQELLRAPGGAYTYGVNAQALNLAGVDREFWQDIRAADVVYADGASLLLAARLLGGSLPEKITTTDLWPELCDLAQRNNLRFYLFGGEPGLAERARNKAIERYPRLNIVGVHDGFTDIFAPETIADINQVKPDIIWAGLGDPLQGRWANVMRAQCDAKLIITCGGMFKIVAGDLGRVSYTWQQRGCEWLYRLWQEPQTWRRYLLGLPLFGLRVLLQRLSGKRTKPRPDLSTL